MNFISVGTLSISSIYIKIKCLKSKFFVSCVLFCNRAFLLIEDGNLSSRVYDANYLRLDRCDLFKLEHFYIKLLQAYTTHTLLRKSKQLLLSILMNFDLT